MGDDFAEGLAELSHFETRKSFVEAIELPGGRWFEDVVVMRPSLKRQDSVACLMLGGEPSEAQMLDLLGRWMRFEKRDYYRIQSERARALCFYDTLVNQGTYWRGPGTDPKNFAEPPAVNAPWDEALTELVSAHASSTLDARQRSARAQADA